MCMICSGLKKGKLSYQEASKKYEEFLDLDLLDEDHQEEVEELLSEVEGSEYYWNSAKQDYFRSKEDYKDNGDYENDILDDNYNDEDYDN